MATALQNINDRHWSEDTAFYVKIVYFPGGWRGQSAKVVTLKTVLVTLKTYLNLNCLQEL